MHMSNGFGYQYFIFLDKLISGFNQTIFDSNREFVILARATYSQWGGIIISSARLILQQETSMSDLLKQAISRP